MDLFWRSFHTLSVRQSGDRRVTAISHLGHGTVRIAHAWVNIPIHFTACTLKLTEPSTDANMGSC